MRTALFFCIVVMISTNLFSQENARKVRRKEADSIAFNNIVQLIESNCYKFAATQVLPHASQSIVFTTDEYFVTINKDSIHCSLPFYGRAYTVDPFEWGGFHFSAVITDYKMKVNNRKQKIEIGVTTKTRKENYKLFFTITGNKNASLTVASNNRSTISYWGNIEDLKIN